MNKDLTQGPVMRSMLLFAVPMILGNLLQQCYHIADTLIVGQCLGKNALAAVGLSFTLMTFLTSILLYGLYQALARQGMSVVLKVISLGTRVVLAYVLAAVPAIGVAGIWWSIPIGWCLADATGIVYYICRRKRLLSWELVTGN